MVLTTQLVEDGSPNARNRKGAERQTTIGIERRWALRCGGLRLPPSGIGLLGHELLISQSTAIPAAVISAASASTIIASFNRVAFLYNS